MSAGPRIVLERVRTARAVALARRLFREYADSLDIDLCFQGFDSELEGLPGDYQPPGGELLLVRVGARIAGCGALRRHRGSTCEMKRLYLRPWARGRGLGRIVLRRLLTEARRLGYRRMVLDTVPSMTSAIRLHACSV